MVRMKRRMMDSSTTSSVESVLPRMRRLTGLRGHYLTLTSATETSRKTSFLVTFSWSSMINMNHIET